MYGGLWDNNHWKSNFEPLLELEVGWYVGRLGKEFARTMDGYWIALHGHNRCGWYLPSDIKDGRVIGVCSECGITFPDTVIGMRNLFNGLD